MRVKCNSQKMRALLSAYADGEVSQTESETVERHLRNCAECRATLHSYTSLRHEVAALQTLPANSDVKEAVLSRITSTNKRRAARPLRLALIGVPVAIAVTAALMVWQPWTGGAKIVSRVQAATANLQYCSIDSTHEITQGGNISSIRYQVSFAAPDRYQVETTSGTTSGQSIRVGGKTYVSGEWPSAPEIRMTGMAGALAFSIAPPTKEDTLALVKSLVGMERLQDETIDGVVCFHFRGMPAQTDGYDQALKDLDERVGRDNPLYAYTKDMLDRHHAWQMGWRTTIDIWIGSGDYLPRRELRTSYVPPFSPDDESATITSDTRYHDLNVPVGIEAPIDAEGKLFPSWVIKEDYASAPKHAFGTRGGMHAEGTDPGHQTIVYEMTLTNNSAAKVSNVRLSVSSITVEGNPTMQTMQAKPQSGRNQIDLAPGESETFSLTWEYSSKMLGMSDYLMSMLREEARYTSADGKEMVEVFPQRPSVATPTVTPPNPSGP